MTITTKLPEILYFAIKTKEKDFHHLSLDVFTSCSTKNFTKFRQILLQLSCLLVANNTIWEKWQMDTGTSKLKATATARGWLATAAVVLSTLAERSPAARRTL